MKRKPPKRQARRNTANAPTCQQELIHAIERELAAHRGSFLSLERQILAAAEKRNLGRPEGDRLKVDRRKLAKLCAGEDVHLSFTELTALDVFLTSRGRGGLSAVFEPPNLLRALADRGRLIYLVGTQRYSSPSRLAVAWWDTRAMHPLISGLNKLPVHVDMDFREVLLSDDPLAPSAGEPNPAGDEEDWRRFLREDGPSVVGIGSPRSNPATEVLLTEMLGGTPFTQPTKAEPGGFYFVRREPMASAFYLPAHLLPKGPDHRLLKRRITDGGSWAFFFKGNVYELPRADRSSPTYGVIVAQRRRTGAIWLAVLGIAGPGTFAAAQCVRDVAQSIPPATIDGDSAPLLLAVRATVTIRSGQPEDRHVEKAELLEA